MKGSLVFNLVIFYSRVILIGTSNTALCFLTTRPKSEMIKFAEELAKDGEKYNMKVFIMIDDNSYEISSVKCRYVKMFHISNSKCILYGYEQTMYVKTRPIQIGIWDRAFLYFCELNQNYSFVWFIEDDVFIPSIHSFRSIHKLYSDRNDLIVQHPIPNWIGDTSKWAHWSLANDYLVLPWYKSMTNAMGMSRRLLKAISDHVQWRGISLLHEILPQSLSINLNLTIVSPIELNTLLWEEIFTWEDIEDIPNNWWHPLKNWTLQKQWHQRIVNESRYINNSIQWSNLSTLCNNDNNSIFLEEDLPKLVMDFNRNKISLSSDMRRSIRQHFLYLAKQCENLKDFESARAIVRELADNAYKLSYNQIPNITKSSNYLILAKTLEQNKHDVFQFYQNRTIVNRLRQEAKNLTRKLSFEIQQDLKQQFQRIHQEQMRLIKTRDDSSRRLIYKLNDVSEYINLTDPFIILYHFKRSLHNNSDLKYILFIIFILSLFILSRFYR